MANRFAVLVGDSSTDLEKTLNAWMEKMERVSGFFLLSALPMPMDGELLYVLMRYQVGRLTTPNA